MSIRVVAVAALAALAGVCQASDIVSDWNNALLGVIKTDKGNPPFSSRSMAMLHGAMYDAVNTVDGTHEAYLYKGSAALGTSREAAAACSARDILTSLYPSHAAEFDSLLATHLGGISDGQSKTDGISLGQAVATSMLAWRADDHSADVVDYPGGTDPGQWRPTPPGFGKALLPNWPTVTPFAMTSGSQFQGPGPRALTSDEYTKAYNEVKDYGRKDSSIRTAEQTEIAKFWSDGGGTETPPGHWNRIALKVAEEKGLSISDKARLMAMLDVAEADAAISSWDNKYKYGFWRPITAVQEGDADTNPDTAGDKSWEPLLTTPNFPEYTSGHSTFSGAAADILAHFFGTDDISFTIDSSGLPGVERSFDSFSEAAMEAAMSRMYGGIHYSFSNMDGLIGGEALAAYITANFFRPIPAPGAASMLAFAGLVALRRKR